MFQSSGHQETYIRVFVLLIVEQSDLYVWRWKTVALSLIKRLFISKRALGVLLIVNFKPQRAKLWRSMVHHRGLCYCCKKNLRIWMWMCLCCYSVGYEASGFAIQYETSSSHAIHCHNNHGSRGIVTVSHPWYRRYLGSLVNGQNCRQMHFHEWKVLYFDSNFIEVCSQGSNWQ